MRVCVCERERQRERDREKRERREREREREKERERGKTRQCSAVQDWMGRDKIEQEKTVQCRTRKDRTG